MKQHRVREFKLSPLSTNIPYNLDGDPLERAPIHVRVLHKKLAVFCRGDDDLASAPVVPAAPRPLSQAALSAETAA